MCARVLTRVVSTEQIRPRVAQKREQRWTVAGGSRFKLNLGVYELDCTKLMLYSTRLGLRVCVCACVYVRTISGGTVHRMIDNLVYPTLPVPSLPFPSVTFFRRPGVWCGSMFDAISGMPTSSALALDCIDVRTKQNNLMI